MKKNCVKSKFETILSYRKWWWFPILPLKSKWKVFHFSNHELDLDSNFLIFFGRKKKLGLQRTTFLCCTKKSTLLRICIIVRYFPFFSHIWMYRTGFPKKLDRELIIFNLLRKEIFLSNFFCTLQEKKIFLLKTNIFGTLCRNFFRSLLG